MIRKLIVVEVFVCAVAALAVESEYSITTVAGNGSITASGDGNAATAAGVRPEGVAVHSNGDLYIGEARNGRVRKVLAADGKISTLVGNGEFPFPFDAKKGGPGDGGPAAAGQLDFPGKVAVDSKGNVYISDTNASMVRRVDHQTGIITTVANYETNHNFFAPFNIIVDRQDNVIVSCPNAAHTDASKIFKIDATTGAMSLLLDKVRAFGIAVDPDNHFYYMDNDGLYRLNQATGARTLIDNSNFNFKVALFDNTRTCLGFDAAGNMYVGNRTTVKRVDKQTGFITTIAGTGADPLEDLYPDGPALSTRLQAVDLAVDSAGNVFIADDILRVRKIARTSPPAFVISITSSQDPSQIGQTVEFTATADTQPPATFTWDFGDGVTASGSTVSHAFETAALFQVRVTASSDALIASVAYPQYVVEPSSTGLNVTNPAQGLSPVQNPASGLKMSVVESNGGIVKLLIDGSALSAAPMTYRTYFNDGTPGRTMLPGVPGANPVHKFAKQGVYEAVASAYDAGTNNLLGTAHLLIAISKNETDESHSGPTKPDSPALNVTAVKGKVTLSAPPPTSKPKKPVADSLSITATLKLPGGYDAKGNQRIAIAIGNVAESRQLYFGKLMKGSTGAIKSLQLKPLKDGTAALKFTISKFGLVADGLDFDGISKTPAAKPVIQLALTLDGQSYFGQAPVELKRSSDGLTAALATPKTK